MKVKTLIEKLSKLNPDYVVQAFDAETCDYEAITGYIACPVTHTIELQTDEID